MSMTREEAIKAFEEIRENAQNNLGAKWAHGCDGYYRDKIELADVALSALRTPTREQVEKVWRGEWKPTESPYMNECEDCSVCGYRTPWGHGFRFCPACGAAQTDEAVDMMLEKWKDVLNEH